LVVWEVCGVYESQSAFGQRSVSVRYKLKFAEAPAVCYCCPPEHDVQVWLRNVQVVQ